MIKKKKTILLMLCTICFQLSATAQRITRQYNNVSFSAALKDLNAAQGKYAINFVYNELEDFKVTKSIRNQSVPDAIQQLIGFYPIKMTQMDNVWNWIGHEQKLLQLYPQHLPTNYLQLLCQA